MKNVIWPLAVWVLLPHTLQLLSAGSHSEYLARHSQRYQSNMEESKSGLDFLLEPTGSNFVLFKSKKSYIYGKKTKTFC